MSNENTAPKGVGSTGGSAMDATQAAEATLRDQVWRNENCAERFCDNAAAVKLVLAELSRVRKREDQHLSQICRLQGTIESLQEQADERPSLPNDRHEPRADTDKP